MKTLINKHNPAIRITAPEIKIEELPHDYYAFFSKKDWTLVEEEPVDLEKAAEDYAHVAYVMPQTFEEKVEMYMKCEKKTLAEMLAMRDMIMAHKNPPQEPVLTKTE